MAEVKWIKITTNMFDDEKIRLIQSMPESDSTIVVWVRLLVLAGKTNDDGRVYITETMPYTEEMLSTLFNKPLNTIRLALNTLQKFGMIEILEDGSILISNWEKHQNIDGLDKIRLQTAERNRKYRERKKQKQIESNRDVSVTSRDGTEVDKELDIDKDNNSRSESIPYKEIIDYLNEKSGRSFKPVDKHKTLIRARWNEGQGLDDFKKVVDIKVKHANDPKNFFDAKYLQPSTLFGNKFDEYLNSYDIVQKDKPKEKTWQEKMKEEGLM